MKQRSIRLGVSLGVMAGSVLLAGPGHAAVAQQVAGDATQPAGPSHISAKPVPSPFPKPKLSDPAKGAEPDAGRPDPAKSADPVKS